MGATKEMSLAENEYIINTTFKIQGRDRVPFENAMREMVNVIDYRVVPDTKELYENDITFRKLVKAESIAKKNKQEYINKTK